MVRTNSVSFLIPSQLCHFLHPFAQPKLLSIRCPPRFKTQNSSFCYHSSVITFKLFPTLCQLNIGSNSTHDHHKSEASQPPNTHLTSEVSCLRRIFTFSTRPAIQQHLAAKLELWKHSHSKPPACRFSNGDLSHYLMILLAGSEDQPYCPHGGTP